MRTLAIFAVGATLAGLLIAYLHWPPRSSDTDDRYAGVESISQVEDRLAGLEAEVGALANRVDAVMAAGGIHDGGRSDAVPTASAAGPASQEAMRQGALGAAAASRALHELIGAPAGFTGIAPGALTPEGIAWRERTNLEDEGFSPERAVEIVAYMAERRRELVGSVSIAEGIERLNGEIRDMLGDDDYERYRRAMFLATSVEVADVLPGSAAERAGILPGDEIAAYSGHRVFELGEINALAAQGMPGQPVLIDVNRDGRVVQLAVERGALGVTERVDLFSGLADLSRAPPASE